PLDRFREPKLGLDLAPRSGPVAITVEYRIRETDPLPDRGELDLSPLDRFREPKLGLDLAPRSGPVAITVEYRIRETD
ncbi:hypothetical protein CNY89_29510, partial [Amaricoccus sp. HAR-UPW-R2A-40]